MRLFIIGMALFFVAVSCSSNKMAHNPEVLKQEITAHLKSNIDFIASDELEGRNTASHGEQIASRFISTRLAQYGIQPHGDNGTYYQDFELYSKRYLESSEFIITDNDKRRILEFAKSFYPSREGTAVENSDLIFVGYGITDLANNHDDYEGLDVAGKTVLCLTGVPPGKPGIKRRSWRTHHKRELAEKKGAVGVVTALNPYWMQRWERITARAKRSSIDEIEEEKQGICGAYIDSFVVKSLFNKPHMKYSDLFNWLGKDSVNQGYTFKEKVTLNIQREKKTVVAQNVVGILPGTDPQQKEKVTLGAHYDHEGIINDQIYNGADDNGSGTVTILESARLLAAQKKNKRSIVFIFYSGEEKGLLGSEYFVANYPYINDAICNINMDMVGREHEDTMFVIGSGRLSGEYFDIVEQANKETSRFVFDYTYDDMNHPERLYYRSDHWSFASNGIPAVFFTDMHRTDYTKPTDDPHKINLEKMYRSTLLAVSIATKVANLDHRLIVDNANETGPVIKENLRSNKN